MKFVLLRSTAFIRAVVKIVKKQPKTALNNKCTLEILCTDRFDTRLRTHKLYRKFIAFL